jgi:hypothetical protein
MKTFKIIQIYKVPAGSKREALEIFHREEQAKFFTAEFAVEDQPQGFWKQALKQITG